MKQNIYVTQSSMPPFEEFLKEIEPLWESKYLTNMGKLHKELEEKLKRFLKVNGVSLVVNGHMALEIILEALELEGEIITTPFTFVSTTHAIVRRGLTPVFCDINENDYTIDTTKIESLITEKTSAILPVHVYGNVCNVEEIDRIAKKYHLKVIYDAAHAFGVEYMNKGIGEYGDASIFSFHATKVFNTIEGGAITYNESELGYKISGLRNFGISSEDEVRSIGLNAKMNEFQAAMGICNLRYISSEIEKRKKVTQWYNERLEGIEGIIPLKKQENVKKNYSYYPVQFVEKLGFSRDLIYKKLREDNIYARKYFFPLTNDVDCYRNKFIEYQIPIARQVSKSILTLPLSANLTQDDVDRIVSIVLKSR